MHASEIGQVQALPNIVAAQTPTGDPVTPPVERDTATTSAPSPATMPAARAAIYVRVSRFDEKDPGISPEMQLTACREVDALQGLADTVFADLNLSGKNTKRPQYQQMLRRIEAREFPIVVAYELSRISRDVEDQAAFFKLIAAHHVTFISAKEHVDVSTPEGKFGAHILASSNQLQREQTQRRVKDALAKKVAQGRPVRRLPAGYRRIKAIAENGVVTTTIEVDPVTGPIIRTLFREYATGSYSFKSLAGWMNREGFIVPRSVDIKPGKAFSPKWDSDKVRNVLGNRAYTGNLTRNDGKRFPAVFEPLVEATTWTEVERLRIVHCLPVRENRKVRTYALTGLLRCSRCGGTVSGFVHGGWRKTGPHPYYQCYQRRQGLGCDQPYFRQSDVEASVVNLLRAMAVPDAVANAMDAAVAAYAKDQRQESRAGRRKKVAEQLGRVKELYLDGDISPEEYKSRTAELKIERDQLETTPAVASIARQRIHLQTVVEDWDRLTAGEQKVLLSRIFAVITGDHVNGKVAISCKPRPQWEPYVEAVLTLKAAEKPPPDAMSTSERKTGLEPATSSLARTRSTN